MRRLERGASFVPLIIVLVLLVIALVWAYVKHDEVDQLNVRLAEAQAQAKEEQQRRIDTLKYLQNLAERVGFPLPDGSGKPTEYRADTEAASAFLQERIANLRSKYVREFPVAVYTFDENGGVKRDEGGGKVTVGYITLGELPSDVTLQNLYVYMEGAMSRMLNDIGRLATEIERLQAAAATEKAGFQAALAAKDQTIARLQSEKSAVETAKSQLEARLNQDVARAEDEMRAAREALATAQSEHKVAIQKMETEVAARESMVQRLKEREKMVQQPIGPDGSVLAVSADQGLAYIDRGKRHHLVPGTTFDVYTLGKGAQKVHKGTLVVLDVDSTQARARISSLADPARPIVSGDMIESLTYNPDEELHVFLLGRTRKYGKADAAARLRQLGVVVDDAVGVDTTYLVLGDPMNADEDLRETEAYKRAQELNVRVITEAQLSSFLDY